MVLSDAFAGADDAEAGGFVDSETGGVFREDSGLNGPDACLVGRVDECGQQCSADALALGLWRRVDGVFDDAGVDATVADCDGGDPAENRAVAIEGDVRWSGRWAAVIGSIVTVAVTARLRRDRR
jgi:hypothetical protein